jgi:hypothetical protein
VVKLKKEEEMGRACCTLGEKRNACRILVGKTEGNRPLGRRRLTRENNIRMDLGARLWWYGLDLYGSG